MKNFPVSWAAVVDPAKPAVLGTEGLSIVDLTAFSDPGACEPLGVPAVR